MRLFVDEMNPSPKAKILEIGAAEGVFVAILNLNGFDALGIDPGETYVQNAQELFRENKLFNTKVVRGYAEAMPFENDTFDYVISYQTLEHVDSLHKTFEEIRRVLKPGGKTFHICPNYKSFYEGHFKVIIFPSMGKKVFKIYIAALKVLTLGLSKMPTLRYVDTLYFVRPDDIKRVDNSIPGIKLNERDGGLITMRDGELSFWGKGRTVTKKKSFQRNVLSFLISVINVLHIGNGMYALMQKNKWYPHLKVTGEKTK